MSTPVPEPGEPTRRQRWAARRKARAEAKANQPSRDENGDDKKAGDKKGGDKKAKKGKGPRR